MKRRLTMWLPKAVVCLALSMTVLPLRAQVQSSLSFRRYTTQDGLPQMQTEKIFQDTRGYIYIGTLSGFVRYDGRTFTPFLKGKRFSIVGFTETEHQVSALSFRQRWLIDVDELTLQPHDPEGLWLLNNFNSGDLPNGYVLFEDEQEEHRWLGKATPSHGYTRIADDAVLDRMTPDRKLYLDHSALYIPTSEGLYRDTLLLSDNPEFYALCHWKDSLYAFAQDGIYIVDGESVQLQTPFDEWQTGYGLIVRTAGSELLIADEHSLYSYDGHAVRKLVGGANLIKDLFVDRWGRLWVATYQGLYCFFHRHFTNHTLTDHDDIVRAVGATTSGSIVMGTLNGKILVNGQTVYDDASNFFIASAACIDDEIYLAGRGDVACIHDTTVTWLGLPYERYQFITEADGKLILGMRQLIAAYDTQTGAIDTLSTEVRHAWCAAEDGEGRLWVGSTFGLFCLSRWQRDIRNGERDIRNGERKGELPVEQVTYGKQKLIITTMEADARGSVFFASGDSLFLIRNGKVEELNSQLPQIGGHEVRSLHVSPHGFLVVATIDALFVCRVSADYQLSDICCFDHQNGFTVIEPLMATMAEADDGTVWLCGVEQMTSFRPAKLVADSQADTFISPPLRWWQHWWVWLLALLIALLAVWGITRSYEKRRGRRKMLRLHREKAEREQLIRAIREEAIRTVEAEKAEESRLANNIVKMTEKEGPQRLTLRTSNSTLVVDVDDIVYLKADGNYTRLVTFHSNDLVLTGIGAIGKQLNEPQFIRADRSTIVNTSYISRLNAAEHCCYFRSPDGKELDTTLLQPAFKRLAKII